MSTTKIQNDNSGVESLSVTAQQLVANNKNRGSIENSDAHARICGCCGDSMQIELLLSGDRIQDAVFDTDGCGASIACGSIITQLAQGKTLAEAYLITPQEVITALGDLPQDHLHCANLAVNTLQLAIKTYIDNK
ncbi:MAG: iron-sulfur cluster assembly scaffold protein [Anaerolineaceae bacterium]|jgi:nitrogen fixation NifU-like protein|nr:MAG: iron-sulfur cluster assembly scaffold protein [Anaerolineaceae bacterium]